MTTIDNRIIVEPGTHSTRGASSASRWIKCPGSILLTEKLAKEGLVKNGSSRAAAEGTAAHLVLSTCLEDSTDAHEMADMEIEVEGWVFVVDQEMVDGVQECLDWVRNRMSRAKEEGQVADLYTEKSLTSMFDDDVYGTADIIIHIRGVVLIIVDFKYGRGVVVEPDSDQNAYYGYLAIENYLGETTVQSVESWIAQPRIPHPAGTIRRFETTQQELTDWWFDTVLPAIAATRDETSALLMGDHCRWCPAKSHCPALKQEAFEFPVGIEISHLDDVELGALLDKLEAIEALKPILGAEALRRARQGARIPGRKLVRKMANRMFRTSISVVSDVDADEMIEISLDSAVTKTFGLDAYAEPKMKSPAQLEKLEGGRAFAKEWAYKPDMGTTLAPSGDKRAEVRPNIERVRGVRS